ncbi:hypothetical protein EDD15DRAFT_2363410 [Pisolithus albus]|nr:hypothetical protein EDD15DRAFT_2363410 [Pisolithus albus]
MSYQIINVNETAKVVPLFRGDYANKEEPADWFTEFQLSLPTTWSEDMKIDRFGLQVAVGSYADEWFTDLPTSDKASLAALKAAFLKRALVLKEEDIGSWIERDEGGDYGHVIWATKVMRLALSMGDTEGKLVEYAVEAAPLTLRNELDEEYESWDEFVEAVRKVRSKKLTRSKEAKKGEQELRNEVAELRQQIGQLTLRHAAQAYQGRPVMRAEGETTHQSYPNQYTRPGAGAATAARGMAIPRVPLTRAQVLEKARAVPHRPSTEQGRRLYEMDVQAWHRAFGEETMPSLERPYPLKPGTAVAGSGECFSCGMVTEPPHMGNTCAAKEMLQLHETRWRQLVASMLRRTTQVRVGPIPVQYAWPVPHQSETKAEANAPHVYAITTGDGWQGTSAEQDEVQEEQWDWAVEGNF